MLAEDPVLVRTQSCSLDQERTRSPPSNYLTWESSTKLCPLSLVLSNRHRHIVQPLITGMGAWFGATPLHIAPMGVKYFAMGKHEEALMDIDHCIEHAGEASVLKQAYMQRGILRKYGLSPPGQRVMGQAGSLGFSGSRQAWTPSGRSNR
jgi:hypothetical protein